jgi:hypothetical protein
VTKPQIDDLVGDIYDLFRTGKDFTPQDTVELANRLARSITKKFKIRGGPAYKDKIRPSNMGHPDRKLWYDLRADPVKEKFAPEQLLNFLYGDICEELMLWLAEQAGHEVTEMQQPVNGYGLRGYKDCKIDGYNVDAKSAFAANFNKFKSGSIKQPESDPYGYTAQISYYEQVETGGRHNAKTAYFFAFNKVGSLCITPVNKLEQIDAKKRIEHLNEIMKHDEPPEELCYEPVADGKGGNMKLGTHCGRCDHKFKCHPNLQVYEYKPWRFLTHVEVEPKVANITRTDEDEKTFKPIPA